MSTTFVPDCSYSLPEWQAVKLTFFAPWLTRNKNALSSSESRLLGYKFCCQRRRCVILLFRLEYKTSVICHNVNTHKVKIARRDRPHILASNRCDFYILILVHWGVLFQGFYTQKIERWFLSVSRGHDSVSIKYIASLYRTKIRLDTFSTEKMCKFNRNLHNTQLIQFAPVPAEFVVRFIRYQYRVKVITFSIAA